MRTDEPVWPLIVVHDGDDELSYVNDLGEWQADASLSAHPHEADDYAIDSQGQVYQLVFDTDQGRVEFSAGADAIARDTFSQIIRNHLGAMKQCCVSKNHDYSFELGFDLVKKTIDA
jgi:protein structure with unknown function